MADPALGQAIGPDDLLSSIPVFYVGVVGQEDNLPDGKHIFAQIEAE